MRGNEHAGWLRPYQSFMSDSSLFDQNDVIYSQICFLKKKYIQGPIISDLMFVKPKNLVKRVVEKCR